jgi:TRAP-type C4-dicarboxylate transport system substrate-binding protein
MLSMSLLMLIIAVPVGATEITLRVHHFLGEDSLPHTGFIEPWARRVEAESKGRIKVEVYPDMALGGKTPELVDQLVEGVVDIVWTAAAYTPGRFPRSEVFTLPLVHKGDPVATNQAIMGSLDSLLYQDFEGMQPLLVHVQAGHALHMGHKPITHLDDFNGMTLRPAGRGAGLWTIEALGAQATKKRHPKLPKALKDKALDGALMSFQLAGSMGVIDAVQSHTLMQDDVYFGTSLYLFLMNQARYESLPEDLRAVIDNNSGSGLAKEAGQVWQKAESKAIAAARASGNTVDILQGKEQESVRTALGAVLERWAGEMKKQKIDGFRLIREARQAIDFQSGSGRVNTDKENNLGNWK